MLAFLGVVVGGIGFRLRGSALFEQWTGRGLGTARLVCWALPCALLSLFVLPWYLAPVFGLAMFLGSLPGWYGTLSLHDTREFLIMFVRGICWTVLGAAVFWLAGLSPLPLLVAGACCPLAYAIGWNIPSQVPNLSRGPELGEVTFGAMVGASIFL